MLLNSGDVIGGYRILDKIGEGGMGQVFRAHQQALNRTVALKLLPSCSSSTELENRFDREIKAHIALSHPHLVKVFDAGREPDFRYIALELIEGLTLRQEIQRERSLSWAQASKLLRQMLDALVYLEGAGIIHRDLKPENIMVDREGILKIVDFGLVKTDTGTTLTQVDQVVGTLRYLAPELLDYQPASPKVDVYAAGLIFFELLTGRSPYLASDTSGLVQSILKGKLTSIRELRPDLGRAQVAFVGRLLERTPTTRPSATQALQLLLKPLPSGDDSFLDLRSTKWGPLKAVTLRAQKFVGVAALFGLLALVGIFVRSPSLPTDLQIDTQSSALAIATASPSARRHSVSWERVIPAVLPSGLPVLPHWNFCHVREGPRRMTPEDWTEVFEHNKGLESGEDADTQLALAVHFGRGFGVERNVDRAKYLLSKAVRGGNGFAMLALGYDTRFARSSDGQPLDESTFEKLTQDWLRGQAAAGVAAAQIDHGLYLIRTENGQEEGLQWLERAAKQGHAVAMESLGFFYQQKSAEPVDQRSSIAWIQRGVEAGDPISMTRMAWSLSEGLGVPVDIAGSKALCRRAYELGEPWGAYQMGLLLMKDSPASTQAADAWFQRSLELLAMSAFSDDPIDGRLERLLADRGHSRKSAAENKVKLVDDVIRGRN